MNTVQRIAKNAVVLLSAQVISYLLAFFYAIYSARYLGPADYGILSFAIAFTALFSFTTEFGLQSLTIREVARDKSSAPRYLINTAIMKVILAVFFFGLIELTVNAMGYSQEAIKVVSLLCLYIILQSFNQLFYSMFQAFEKMEYQALGQILNSALILIGVMLAISFKIGLVSFGWLYCAASVVALLCNFSMFIWKFAKPRKSWLPWKVEIKWDFWKRTLRAALPFTLSVALIGIFLRVDIVMISAFKGDIQAGNYNATCNIIIVLVTCSAIISTTAFPAMSRFFVSSKDSLQTAMEKLSKYLFILGLPIAAGTFILADKIIFIIYGTGYDQAATALKVLALHLPVRFLCNPTGWTLAAINKEHLRTLSVGIAMLTNVILNFILIPPYGILGAGVATVTSQLVMFLLFLYFITKRFHGLAIRKIMIKPCIACAVMGTLTYFIREESLLLVIPSAVVLYLALLLILRTFDAKDLKIFKDVIKGINKLLPICTTKS